MHCIARVLFLLALFLEIGCSGSRQPTKRADLEAEFKEEFGFIPSPQVTLRCKVAEAGDSWAKWLCFSFVESDWKKIVSKGFDLVDAIDFDRRNPVGWPTDRLNENPNAPIWWPRASSRSNVLRLYYVDRPYKQGATPPMSSYAYLWVDEENKLVYWHRTVWQ